jgi:steroid delta-isomerase-like uncharacterized protein
MTNKEFAKAWFKAIDAQDYATLKGRMASDHVFHNPMAPAPLDAAEHIGMIQMMMSAFKGEHSITLMVEDDSHVVVRGRWKGTHTGPFNGVPASNKTVEFTFTDVMEIKNGKLSREALEMNPMAIMTQIGAMPAAA